MSCMKTIAFTCFASLAFSVVSAQAAAPAASATGTPKKETAASPATSASAKAPAKPKTKLKLAANDTVIYVGDLHCKHCAKKIASKLFAVKGVVKVRTDLKADVAIVSPQAKKKLDPLALWKAAQTSGFPAVKLVGPTGTYVANAKTKAAELLPTKKQQVVKQAVAPKG